ncbi:MAG: hypothetical protein HQL77_15840 [Magnetococcales bacterium]|nr:hypothetical protein [Magnetococcales bacterium]
MIDIERMAKWHLPEIGQEPDRHKYAGFLSKWIAKTKPIYINSEQCGTDIPIEIHLINACFAYDVFGSFLEFSVPEEIRKSLVYSFHFREDRGESLALLAYTCEEISRMDSLLLKPVSGESVDVHEREEFKPQPIRDT